MKRFFSSTVCAGVLTAACIAVVHSADAADSVAVKTVEPRQVTLRKTTSQPATARAYYTARLFAKLAGYAESVKVDIGDVVKSGQPLLVIAVPEMAKAYERAEAEMSLLKLKHERLLAEVNVAKADFAAIDSELRRVRQLLKTKAISEKVGDETENRHASAQARLRVAEIESKTAAVAVEVSLRSLEESKILLDYATVRAPFDGIVTQRSVEPGDLVRNSATGPIGEPLFTVAKTDVLRVTVAVPERDAVWITKGDKAEITFSGIPGKVFQESVSRSSGSLDPKTRTLSVEIDVPNKEGTLIPGMYGNVVIVMREKTGLVVPSGAVRFNESGSESIVYVVKGDNVIAHVPVKIGMDDGHHIEILSGLTGGERIVTAMLNRLADGQAVKVLGN